MAGSAVPLAQICILQFDKGPGGMLQTPAGRRGFLCVAKALHGLLAASAALTACGGGSASGSAGASVSNGAHEPISICAPIRSGKNPLGKTIPILAMTANAFTEDMEKSKEAGMDEHLSKPVDIAVLERAVRKYLVTPPPPENERPSTEIYPVSP